MPSHRASRIRARRRVGTLVGALAVTALVGVCAVVVAPQLKDTSVATVSADRDITGARSTLETSALDTVDVPAETQTAQPQTADEVEPAAVEKSTALPADSGEGRRIVFDQGDQRVWLVGADGTVERTYPVSGSRFDNLGPGIYQVQSRTRDATAFDASGTMEYFVRFATGYREPIGFHSVPRYNNGELEQTKAQLGTRLSAGCVRQWEPDAIALWDFAPVGTSVVVTA